MTATQVQDTMMELVDFVVTTDEGAKLPGFNVMSDARTFAMLLRDDTNRAYYAHEYEYAGAIVYVVY
jgi:hypothetical protein